MMTSHWSNLASLVTLMSLYWSVNAQGLQVNGRSTDHSVNKVVSLGQSLNLTCDITGPKGVKKYWRKDDMPLKKRTMDSRYSVVRKTNVFTISSIEQQDAGTFTCRGKNAGKKVDYNYNIIIGAEPKIVSLTTESPEVSSQSTIRLTCEFQGSPVPTVTWRFGGAEVQVDQRTDIVDSDGSSTLTIHEVTTQDAGWYTCVVSNKIGQAADEHVYQRVRAEPTTVMPTTSTSPEFFDFWDTTAMVDKAEKTTEAETTTEVKTTEVKTTREEETTTEAVRTTEAQPQVVETSQRMYTQDTTSSSDTKVEIDSMRDTTVSVFDDTTLDMSDKAVMTDTPEEVVTDKIMVTTSDTMKSEMSVTDAENDDNIQKVEASEASMPSYSAVTTSGSDVIQSTNQNEETSGVSIELLANEESSGMTLGLNKPLLFIAILYSLFILVKL